MENYFDQNIEAYLNHSLNDKETNEFEKRVATDFDFADDVAIYTTIKKIFEEGTWHSLQVSKDNKEVEKMEAFLRSEKAKSISKTIKRVQINQATHKSKTKNLFFYAAAIVGIIVVVSFFINLSTPSNTKLYAKYKSFDDLPSLSVRGYTNQDLKIAEGFFRSADYSKSLPYFKAYLSQNQEINTYVYIYYGFSLLETNTYDKAIASFDSFAQQNKLDSENVNWYKALVYLKKGDRKLAKKQLSKITANKDNYKYQEAVTLLKELE